MAFKVGDRVVVKDPRISPGTKCSAPAYLHSFPGTVVKLDGPEGKHGVEFRFDASRSGGHDAEGTGQRGRCLWISPVDLLLEDDFYNTLNAFRNKLDEDARKAK